jgi:aryl-alcohol dehydrogenase-like predicted oxidoreductase
MLDAFRPIAENHKVSLAQLAIAWTIHQRGCSHALVGARRPDQAVENARAGDITLSDDELNAMQQAVETHAASIP